MQRLDHFFSSQNQLFFFLPSWTYSSHELVTEPFCLLFSVVLLPRDLWPSLEPWSVGCRTTWESSAHPMSSVRPPSISCNFFLHCRFALDIYIFCLMFPDLISSYLQSRWPDRSAPPTVVILFPRFLGSTLRTGSPAPEGTSNNLFTAQRDKAALLWRQVFSPQDHLWVDSVYQQETLIFCCTGSRLFPNARGTAQFGKSSQNVGWGGEPVIRAIICVWIQILDAMNQDSGIPLTQLQVDGGMTNNRLLMQLQADILCIPVGEGNSGGKWQQVVETLSAQNTEELWIHPHWDDTLWKQP